MGVITELFETRSTSTLANPSDWLRRWVLGGNEETYTGKTVTHETALSYTAWAGAVLLLSETMGSLPLHLYRRQDMSGREAREMARDHPLDGILHRMANPEMTAMEFRSIWESHLLSDGNFYAQKIYDNGGRLRELWPLEPTRMEKVFRDSANSPIKYLYRLQGGEPVALTSEEVFHVRTLSRNGLKGIAPLEMLRQAVAAGLAVEEYAARFFSNSSTVRGVLQTDNTLTADAFKNLKRSWNEVYRGQANAHKVAILEQGLKFQQISATPKDSQMLDLRGFQVLEVARVTRIPPHLLANLERATFNNIEELGIGFVKYSILHRSERYEQEIYRQLLTDQERKAGYYAKHNLKGLLRGDTKTQAEFYRVMHETASASPNDIRGWEDLEPYEGGDIRTLQSNRATPKQISSGVLPGAPKAESSSSDEGRAERRTAHEDRRIALREAFEPVFREAVGRVVGYDVSRVEGAGLKALRQRNEGAFLLWLDEHREALAVEATRKVSATLQAYSRALGDAIRSEIDSEASTETIAESAEALAAGFGVTYANSSAGQLRAVVREAAERGEDPVEAVKKRTSEWKETRANKTAHRESVFVSGAVARTLYLAAGVPRMRWRTVGKNCPMCNAMDGRIVRDGQPFLKIGDTLAVEGANPLTPKRNIPHPPLHKGCDCLLSPG